MSLSERDLRERAEACGQGHIFSFWPQLDSSSRQRLLGQVAKVDFDLLAHHVELLRAPSAAAERPVDFEPPELFPLERDSTLRERAHSARQRGEEILSSGRVGFLLVAGGQASRLGYDGPKGAFPVGPVSERSLFELHARRIRAAQDRWGVPLPWYVMTSPANDEATRLFFDRHGSFGLDPGQVSFFSQAMIPAMDTEGRILMSAPDSLFLAPDGHGGTLSALAQSGCLADARARGVTVFSYFQVDNPLVRPADPLFLGLHDASNARMSSKVVSKRGPDEKVGVIGKSDGRLGCIEYSDLPESLREARADDDRLLFGAGNIAAHLLELDFIEELTSAGLELPWHVARKTMRCVGPDGRPREVEGAKFESFIFDALGKSPSSVTLEVERALEFSPVKNRAGEDSPATARRDLCRLFSGWVERAGLELPAPDSSGVTPVEVDPLLAENESDFRTCAPHAAQVVRDAGHLYDRP